MKQKSKKTTPAKKLDEGFWDALIGPTAAAGLQAMGKGGMTAKEQLTQNIFIRDFVADAIGALTNAIKTGIVSTDVAPGPNTTNYAAPNANITQGGPAKPAASAPSPNTTAPPAASTTNAAPGAAPSGMTKPAAGAPPPVKKPIDYTKNQPNLKENEYKKLNNIFESILEATGGQSIEKFLQNWFARYMTGINYSQYQNDVNRLISQVAASYKQDGGKKALTNLASAAYSISKVAGSMPKDNEASKSVNNAPQTAPASPAAQAQAAAPVNVDLSKYNDAQLKDLLTKVYSEYTARQQKAKTTPPNATAPVRDEAGRVPPQDIAETRKRK